MHSWPRPRPSPGFAASSFAYVVVCTMGYVASDGFLTEDGVSVWFVAAALNFVYLARVGLKGAPVVLVTRLAAAATIMEAPFRLENATVTGVAIVACYVAVAMAFRRARVAEGSRLRAVAFVLLCGAGAGLAAAALAVSYLVAVGPLPLARWPATFLSFWLGDASAVLMLAPALLLTPRPDAVFRAVRRLDRGGRVEVLALGAAVVATAALAEIPGGESQPHYPMFVPLVWVAMRFGLAATTWVIAATGALVPVFAMAAGVTVDDMTSMQLFMVVYAAGGLLLAAGETDRRRGRTDLEASERALKIEHAELRLVEESNRRFRSAFEEAPFGVELALAHGVIDVNQRLIDIAGRPREELLGLGVAPYLHAEDRLRLGVELSQSEANGDRVFSTEARVVRPDGSERWVRGTIVKVGDDADTGITRIVHIDDITEARTAQAAVRSSQARFAALVERSADVICVIDVDGCISYLSPAGERLLGERPGARVGTPLLAIVHEDDRVGLTTVLGELASAPGEARTVEVRIVTPDERIRHVEIVATNRLLDPAVRGIVANMHDVTERTEALARLQWQAFHDPLTLLPNRAMLSANLAGSLERSRCHGQVTALLYLDLDRFKLINDTLGHDVGDQLLVAVATKLEALAPAGATVARIGGDEFVVLLERLDGQEHAIALAARIIDVVAEPIELDVGTINGSVSIGIAFDDAHTPDSLLRDADTALYRAKDRGRNRYDVFDDSLRVAALRRLAAENVLRRALDDGQLVLHYQPVFDLVSGLPIAAEALLRVPGPGGELQSPGEFIEVAEESGLIVAVGAGALDAACHTHRRWLDIAGEPRRMTVNVSPRQLASQGFVGLVDRTLRTHRLAPSDIVLELTETSLIQGDRATVDAIDQLHRLGVGLAIDDFGTGYSSLAYLKRFPIDIVKIDRSFVAGLGTDGNDSEIVRAITSLGRSLGIVVVGEGIETPEQLAELLALGCDAGQGFLLGVPMPVDRLLAEHRQTVGAAVSSGLAS